MERELVERAMHGDEEAFDTLVGRIGDSLHSVARRILRDTTLAQDATQQALLDAWRNLPQLRDPDRFEAWTHRLLVNACYAEARRERRHRGNLRLLPHDGGSAPDSTSRIAIQDQLDRGFRRLSVEHRTVVVLVHYLGLSPTEAAERMGTPAGTARSRLHYALQELRSALEADARATSFARHGMTRDDDFIGQLEGYLEEYEGSTPLPNEVRDAVRAQLPSIQQRPAWWPARRFPEMNSMMKLSLAAAAVVVAALLGYNYLVAPSVGGPGLGDPSPTRRRPRPPQRRPS